MLRTTPINQEAGVGRTISTPNLPASAAAAAGYRRLAAETLDTMPTTRTSQGYLDINPVGEKGVDDFTRTPRATGILNTREKKGGAIRCHWISVAVYYRRANITVNQAEFDTMMSEDATHVTE